jgi:transcriptional regulator GlxA family with amidase domain
MGRVQVAIAMTPGVSADECEAFLLVFELLDDVEIVRVGELVGPIDGPGGGQHVDARYADVPNPDVVLVPGGLGCVRAAGDDRLLSWLRAVAPGCRWLAASSTGTVTVAAAGLLDGDAVATHWLAAPILETFGSTASSERIVESGNVITCEGHVTAMHVALLVTLRLYGPVAVAEVRRRLASPPTGEPPGPRWWQRGSRRHSPARRGATRPRNRELEAPDVIELEPLSPRR